MIQRPDRKLGVQLEIERLLRPFLVIERAEILARVSAHSATPHSQDFPQFTEHFKATFAAEHAYLAECHRHAHRQREEGIS
jgi:hypothetical protein